jgi:hypothetical protein
LPHQVTALVTQMLSRERTRRPKSLEEISQVLGHYTAFRAPSFGAPSVDAPASVPDSGLRETQRPRAQVVASRDADPQGATMLSTPPVGSSVAIEPASQTARPRRMRQAVLAVIAIIVAIVGLSSLGVFGSSERAAQGAPSAAPVPIETAAPTPEPAATTGVSSETPAVATAVAPQKPAATQKTQSKTGAVKKVRSKPAVGAPKAETNEDNLFSGRK